MRDDRSLTALLERCQARAAAAGGTVEVSAAAEGETIEVLPGDRVPVAESRGGVSATPLPSPDDERPATILVADDAADVVLTVQAMLAPEGYKLITCSDGKAALQLAIQHLPDLVLLDWQMPEMDGIEVCRALRRAAEPRLRAVPIVMLTSMMTAEHTETGFAAGATDYLTKPASVAVLRSKVQQWVMRTRQARARWESGREG
jgi:CheY-like chemotaxis protein